MQLWNEICTVPFQRVLYSPTQSDSGRLVIDTYSGLRHRSDPFQGCGREEKTLWPARHLSSVPRASWITDVHRLSDRLFGIRRRRVRARVSAATGELRWFSTPPCRQYRMARM